MWSAIVGGALVASLQLQAATGFLSLSSCHIRPKDVIRIRSPGSPSFSPRTDFQATQTPRASPVMLASTAQAPGATAAIPRTIDVKNSGLQSLPDMWDMLARECGDCTALLDPLHGGVVVSLTYKELLQQIELMAGALQGLGVEREDCVSVFSENSHRWLVTEQGIMKAGGCNAVRGVAAPVEELRYIYDNSRSVGLVVEKADLLKKLSASWDGFKGDKAKPRFIMVLYAKGMSGEEIRKQAGVPDGIKVVTYKEALTSKHPFYKVKVEPYQKATLVYTSGTTSKPKGVVLLHQNLLHQVFDNSFNREGKREKDPWVQDVFVSILPCWHIFERTAEYWMFARGVQMIYSNLRNFKTDLKKHKPHFLVAVPRLLEVIYKGVQQQFASQPKAKRNLVSLFTAICTLNMKLKRIQTGLVIRSKAPSILEKLWATLMIALLSPLVKVADKLVWSKIRDGVGGRIKAIVSGGSSLAPNLEDFFEMANCNVIVGYGLTETSPVIANRLAERNLRGSVGVPPPGTTIKLVNQETRELVPVGEIGVICVQGPQVMSEYNSNPVATAEAIDQDGFFDTGDLGRINPATGDLILTGRAKDTIVLTNGENVEPQPIEDAVLAGCKLVDQIMVVGHQERSLGAVVAVNPTELGKAGLILETDAKRYSDLLGATPLTTGVAGTREQIEAATLVLSKSAKIKTAVMEGIQAATKNFRPWERVANIVIMLEPFNMANGLMTQTLKVKRNVVEERFSKQIAEMFEEIKKKERK